MLGSVNFRPNFISLDLQFIFQFCYLVIGISEIFFQLLLVNGVCENFSDYLEARECLNWPRNPIGKGVDNYQIRNIFFNADGHTHRRYYPYGLIGAAVYISLRWQFVEVGKEMTSSFFQQVERPREKRNKINVRMNPFKPLPVIGMSDQSLTVFKVKFDQSTSVTAEKIHDFAQGLLNHFVHIRRWYKSGKGGN